MKTSSVIILLAILLSSCVVSKKKYEACLLEKDALNQELKEALKTNDQLESNLKSNISEFEKMKNELHLSNAVKSDEMSDLLIKVTQLTDENNNLSDKLAETLKLYKTQKQTSASTTQDLKELRTANIKLKRDTASVKYALKLANERYAKLESELRAQKVKLNELRLQNKSLSDEAETQKQMRASFEQQLVSNKEKLEVISTELIELRKEMLSAKSAKKVIDPNKNKHIDKMAKTLGHY